MVSGCSREWRKTQGNLKTPPCNKLYKEWQGFWLDLSILLPAWPCELIQRGTSGTIRPTQGHWAGKSNLCCGGYNIIYNIIYII